jgi:hypothetical protein
MLIEIYIFFQVVVIGLFIASFFTKQEILWAITLVISGILMFSSYNIEYYLYQWNMTTSAYQFIAVSNSYPYLMGINMLFFILAMVLVMFDIFDKYGTKLLKKGKEE